MDLNQFSKAIDPPQMKPVQQYDGEPLSPHLLPEACSPFRSFGKTACDFTVEDAKSIILADLGQVSQPDLKPIRGRQCYISLQECAPEALFRPADIISYSFDIWSLACTIWDIMDSTALFKCGPNDQNVLVADQICALGIEALPQSWREEWESEPSDNDVSPDDGSPLPRRWRPRGTYKMLPLEARFEDGVQRLRRKLNLPAYENDEKEAILSLMRGMLAFKPEDRLCIQGVLESEWMVKWALPALGDSEVVAALTSIERANTN
jgi:serine/threonine protein kinase